MWGPRFELERARSISIRSTAPTDSTLTNSLGRTSGTAAVNLDVPVSRRGRDFSALGNLTVSANAEIDQLSDFGTLTKIGANANWSPADRLNFVTSWTREEGPPTINQLGDPLLTTPNVRIFDFTTGQTVSVTTLTGGNPNLQADRRTVFKLGGYWKPSDKTDLTLARRLRAPEDREPDLFDQRDSGRLKPRFPIASCAVPPLIRPPAATPWVNSSPSTCVL